MARSSVVLLSALLAITLPSVEATNPCPGGFYGVIASALAQHKPAQTYCSSKYPVPVVTSTITAPTTTKTSTVAVVTVTTTIATNTLTITAPPVFETDTVVVTSTVSSTSTVTAALPPQRKRHEVEARAAAKQQKSSSSTTTATKTTSLNAKASAFSSLTAQAISFVRKVCTCLETAKTTTTTTTPSTTISTTGTSTIFATQTDSVTTTPTISTTVTNTVTVTTLVATVTVGPTFLGPVCNSDGGLTPGTGGCSSNCYCDIRKQQPAGVTFQYGMCDTATTCGTSCQSDGDCPTGQACAAGSFFGQQCSGGSSCVDYTACSSSLSMKREVFVRGSELEKAARAARAKGAPSRRVISNPALLHI
ncbi:hypothetical protein EJ07DRAFT_158788 [Lizonia empirigonia]|nr:hypothetical protein EJ07DRAFT_158788 [Lizonia empirigonia]